MRAMLGPAHADRRQLRDLVAAEPPARAVLLGCERTTAPTTRIRVVIDDLINLILGLKLTTRTRVPRLPTSSTPFSL